MAGTPWYAVLQFDGTHFSGWQRQPGTRTVQSELEAVLSRLSGGRRLVANAAGRTDTGVHALAQVVSFRLPRLWNPQDLHRALNALLPNDIWVTEAGEAPPGFHARKHATARRYRYVIGCDGAAFSPFRRPFEWALGKPLDLSLLERAARDLAGEHDFRGLSATGQKKPHYRCRVFESRWQARGNAEGFIFDIEADRFLHRMVRFLVGTMVDIGLGRRPVGDMSRLLDQTHNADASPPAPPEGLYLVAVRYPQFSKGFGE